jgi:hypothetical protein
MSFSPRLVLAMPYKAVNERGVRLDAVNKITECYAKLDKIVHLRHLSGDCRQLLQNADKLIEVNILEDPTYKVSVDFA